MKKLFLTIILALTLNSAVAGTKVEIETSMGVITIELFNEKAPKTVANFLSYINKKYYDGTIFHRVIDNFMIQGGGFTADLKKKSTDKPIDNEAHNGLSNDNGTIAMARTSDIKSATSQFFINVKDNKFLNHRNRTSQGYGYAVFGKVIKGMTIINKMKKTKTKSAGGAFANLPVENIIIKSMKKL